MDENKTLIRERDKVRNGRVLCTQKFRFWRSTVMTIII